MNYPSISDYIEALRDAEDSLSELKDLRLVYDDQGHPIMSSGNFAVVFKMQAPTGEYHALKCFLRDQEERSERYRLIAEELQYVQSTYLVKFRYLESELFVDVPNTGGEEYPVLLMDWVDGIPLDQYLKTIINKSYEKDLLAYRFSLLARWLVTQPFAHGDLKPDNICVRDDGSLVLLDYDGMYVPALSGRKPLEQGSPHYRHPLRSTLPFDEHIDDYSLSLILLSLRAIALDETLYVRYSSSEYLLLSEQDQLNPYTSPVFKELNRLVLSLDFINSYHTYLKSLQDTTYYLEARNLQLLAPILMFRRAAEMGDPRGMYKLGVCYEDGKGGLKKDYAKAVELYRKAVEAGNANAVMSLGVCYDFGLGGLTEDGAKAVEWWKKAAEQGNAEAQFYLGVAYDNGEGVGQSKSQAVYWYKKAAEQGLAEAQFILGAAYSIGEGVEQSKSQAVYWYKKASEQGNAAAQYNLGVAYFKGEGVEQSYSQAVYWYKKAAEQGDAAAQFNLGKAYYNGEGVEQSYSQAVYWYKKAAEQGNANAQFNLGYAYYNGEGVEKSKSKAVYWNRKAAEQGNAYAQFILGAGYYYGEGVEQSKSKALYWLRKACNNQYNEACNLLNKIK